MATSFQLLNPLNHYARYLKYLYFTLQLINFLPFHLAVLILRLLNHPAGNEGLEINERPLKRPFSDFQNLSISESSQKEELKSKKVFVQYVNTVKSSQDTVDIVQYFIPSSADATDGITKSREGRRPQKADHRQEQLSKSIQKQEAFDQKKAYLGLVFHA